MYLSTAIAVASSAGLAAAHPLSSLRSRAVAAFPAASSWDIVLNKGDSIGNINQVTSENVGAIDIDLFDTPKATIGDLKANMQVICYFSAGSKEGWRSDAGDFKAEDVGKGLDGWPDENWVNVKSDNVRAIMKKRIELAAANGCSAIDPDNVDGFGNNQDGFGYDKSAYVDYVKFLATTAAANNLAIGLKNAIDIISDVVDVVQFAVNEQCHQYGECGAYKPFTDANKAVFNIEYGGNACDNPAGVKLSTLIKPEDQGLNTLGGACTNQGQVAQPAPGAPEASASATASAGPIATSPPIMPPASSASAPASSNVAAPTGKPAPRPAPTSVAAQPTATGTDDGEEPAEPTATSSPDDEEDGDDNDDDDADTNDDDDEDTEGQDDENEDEDDDTVPTPTPTVFVKPRPSTWKTSWQRPGHNDVQ